MSKVVCQTCGRSFQARGTRGPKPKECPDCRRGDFTVYQIKVNKIKYSWSKYGSRPKSAEKESSWHCQVCGKEMPSGLPGYMFEAFPGEYIRLCSDCQFFVTSKKISVLSDLMKEVK